MSLGGAELLILVGIAVLLFGAGWLPKAARNLGKAKVEFDEVQRQFNDAKDSVVQSSGVKELESTMRKANQVMKSSPQKLMKDAATSAATGRAAANTTDSTSSTDPADDIEDAEIVEVVEPVDTTAPSDATEAFEPATASESTDDRSASNNTTINLDFG